MNMEDYNFNFPGRIVEFAADTQLATVRICVERNHSSSDVTGETIVRGLLQDVPVHTPSGGGWSITMPIKEGDTCIIFFSQVGYDHWLYEDSDEAGTFAGNPMYWTKRKFSLQDGYALVGLNTIPRAIASYSDVHSQWRNLDATQLISLNEDGSIGVDSTTKVIVTAPEVEVVATTSVTLTTPSVVCTGDMQVNGNISVDGDTDVGGKVTATGDVEGAGKSLSTHVHLVVSGSSAGPTRPPT
jgi:hypothetical protein